MNQKELQQIMVCCKHVKELEFHGCYIPTDEECDFNSLLSDSKVEVLDFSSTGNSDRSQWNLNGAQRFKNIIKGLSKEQGIQDNLKEISLLC